MDNYYKYIKYKKKYLKLKYKLKNGGYKKLKISETNIENKNTREPNDIIEIDKSNNKFYGWRNDLPLVKYAEKNNLKLYDENNKKIILTRYEVFEQYMISKWIKPNDIVLELGGRYGVVSCTINMLLNEKNKKMHIVVEPDEDIKHIIQRNKKLTDSKFYIFDKAINDKKIKYIKNNEFQGLANYTTSDDKNNIKSKDKTFETIDIENIKHKDFFKKFKQKFNVLVADCEGCLCDFFTQNEKILSNLEMLIFEMDREDLCDYEKIFDLLKKHDFIEVDSIDFKHYNKDDTYKVVKFQQVWIKKTENLNK